GQGHVFCFTCLDEWASRQTTCPSCRSSFLSVTKIRKEEMEANN
ncbi:unnamed protein product, partial [Laminaria digitata]